MNIGATIKKFRREPDMLFGRRSPESKAAVCKKALAMYQLIYEKEDYGFEEGTVSQIYEFLAKIYLEMNQYDLAVEAAEQYVRHALKQNDVIQNGFSHSSVMFDGLKFEKDNYTRSYTETMEEKLLHYLEDSIYDPIRDTKGFQKLLAGLGETGN